MRVIRLASLALLAIPLYGQVFDGTSVYAVAGKSTTNWHGQDDIQMLNIEFQRTISPRTDFGFVVAPMNVWQPRSWFGDLYGDGNENVRAISGSLLLRRKLDTHWRKAQLFIEMSSGPMWAEKRIPASTSRFNFISQAGFGVTINPDSRVPFIVGYRFFHISNAGYAPRNPGLNVFSLMIGTRFGSAIRGRRGE